MRRGQPEDTVAIVFERRGAGTDWLARRACGEYLDVLGFLGNGFAMEPEGRYLLVGGGIGVPPMRGCAQYTMGRSTAILGFRTAQRAILLDCFKQECAQVLVATDDGLWTPWSARCLRRIETLQPFWPAAQSPCCAPSGT